MILSLLHIFQNDSAKKEGDTEAQETVEDIDLSKITKLKDIKGKKSQFSEIETNIVKNILTESYVAGLCLNDIAHNRDWVHRFFLQQQNKGFIAVSFIFNIMFLTITFNYCSCFLYPIGTVQHPDRPRIRRLWHEESAIKNYRQILDHNLL